MEVDFDKAVEALKKGKPLVFTTDTVVGVGLSVKNSESLDALYRVKGRERGKPIAWLVGSPDDLEIYGADLAPYAKALAKAFWPGALTLVVKASDEVPAAFRSSEGTIGLRMPADRQALSLIGACGSPIAATSANWAGSSAPTRIRDLDPEFSSDLAVLLESEAPCVPSAASTVLDCTRKAPRILRAGTITSSEIERALSPF